MQNFQNIAFFNVEVGGVDFKMRRRSTALMLQIGNVRQVFGLLAKAKAKTGEDFDEKTGDEATMAYAKMLDKTIEVALVEVDGQPVESLGLLAGELSHVADPLFKAFMESGLEAGPTPGS